MSPSGACTEGGDGAAGGRRGAGVWARHEDLLAWSCCTSPAFVSSCEAWWYLRLREQAVGSVLQGEEVRDAAGCTAGPIQAVIPGEGFWGKESNREGWFLSALLG